MDGLMIWHGRKHTITFLKTKHMINDIYNSSISTCQYIPHSNYDIKLWCFSMFAYLFTFTFCYTMVQLLFLIEDYYLNIRKDVGFQMNVLSTINKNNFMKDGEFKDWNTGA